MCTRCGRYSHSIDKCYAKTHYDGSCLGISCTSVQSCSFCTNPGHSIDQCPRRIPFSYRNPVEQPPRGRFIANIQGSSLDAADIGKSWRKEAMRFTPEKQCVVLGCGGEAEEGCHVWVKGERRFYYIAPLCQKCNHRHGEEEICWCRYIMGHEEPKQWIPIRDVWLMQVGNTEGKRWLGGSRGEVFRPFKEWCEKKKSSHSFRERCSYYCPGRGGSSSRAASVVGSPTRAYRPWPLEDDKYLLDNKTYRVKDLATHLNRSEGAIRERLNHLCDRTHSAYKRLASASALEDQNDKFKKQKR